MANNPEILVAERRAPVQGDHKGHGSVPPGTIAWAEHQEAWAAYTRHWPGQSAERIAERAGFSYSELVMLLGRHPTTWRARDVEDLRRGVEILDRLLLGAVGLGFMDDVRLWKERRQTLAQLLRQERADSRP